MIKFKTKGPTTPAPVPASAPKAEDHEPEFKIKDFPQNYITYHVHKATAGVREARHHNVVHASDLDPARDWCPREPALLTVHNKKRKAEFASTAQRMTWAMGYKGADLLMDLIPKEKVWGNWKCRACKHEVSFSYTPDHCPGCGGDGRALRYVEVFLRDPQTGIVGSVDLFVDILGNGIKTPVEIKTEGNAGFEKRTKAEFDHEWRTKLYLWLIERTPQVQNRGLNTQEGRVIYLTKEGWRDEPKIKEWGLPDWAKSAMKEYWVPRDDSVIQNRIDLAMTYRQWRNAYDAHEKAGGGQLGGLLSLPEGVCGSPTCSRAKQCEVRAECFPGVFNK